MRQYVRLSIISEQQPDSSRPLSTPVAVGPGEVGVAPTVVSAMELKQALEQELQQQQPEAVNALTPGAL